MISPVSSRKISHSRFELKTVNPKLSQYQILTPSPLTCGRARVASAAVYARPTVEILPPYPAAFGFADAFGRFSCVGELLSLGNK